MAQATIFGQNFSMGSVSVSSRYDRVGRFGYLSTDIEAGATLDQRKSVAMLMREFADELERAE